MRRGCCSAAGATGLLRRLWAALGGLVAASQAVAVEMPEDRADALLHHYDGGGTRASGPAFLVRKSLADRVQLSGTVYVDMVSNASIDVVTTASPYRETRTAADVALDWGVRDGLVRLGIGQSREPDYRARSLSLDISEDVFGGMSTVTLGFTRGADDVGRSGDPLWQRQATHWNYRLGLTQVLTPHWVASANLELLADDGYLGSPYRVARVFGAAVPERVPDTRNARALRLSARGNLPGLGVLRGEYRYTWDTWALKSHTLELGHGRPVGEAWTLEGALRYYRQAHALFYSDNAAVETRFVSRNRQLSSFSSLGLQARVSHTLPRPWFGRQTRIDGTYEFKRYSYRDFTDIRTGAAYGHNASLLQVQVSTDF